MSDTKQYNSIYGAGLIRADQYIAEVIIARQSKFLKVNLPNKFWSNVLYAEWSKKYQMQLRKAIGFNRAGYPYEVIISAINSKSGQYICTLNNKKLDFILSEELRKYEQNKVNKIIEPEVKLEVSDETKITKVENGKKKTITSKLRD